MSSRESTMKENLFIQRKRKMKRENYRKRKSLRKRKEREKKNLYRDRVEREKTYIWKRERKREKKNHMKETIYPSLWAEPICCYIYIQESMLYRKSRTC